MLETSDEKGIFGCHSFPAMGDDRTSSSVLNISDQNIFVTIEGENVKTGNYFFRYKRHLSNETIVEKLLTSSANSVTICILPVPPLYTSQNISNHLCLRFRSSFIVDQHQKLDFYTKMPIEIGIFRQSNKKGILLIDCISLCKQQYILYGTPENGLICRYKETDIYATETETSKFEEALISMHISNNTDKIIQINKLIIPLQDVIINHRNDNAYLSGRTEIKVGSSFGKDIANVQLVNAKIRDPEFSPIQSREDTLTFLMDKGF